MTASLKSFLPILGAILNEKADTLYERQRALVREGLLESLPGRGRGSGVQTTAENVAILVIGMLASVTLADAASATRALIGAAIEGGPCPLTGATNFKDAVARILSDPKISKRVREIRVVVTHGTATIGFERRQSTFRGKDATRGLYRKGDGINMEIAIGSAMVSQLSGAVNRLLNDSTE